MSYLANARIWRMILPLVLCLMSLDSLAGQRIAILDFELKDLTLAPGIPAEIQRTASIRAMLENELEKAGYEVVTVHPEAQQNADVGVGYLFDHDDVAAELAKPTGADYVLVGRLHKPSFLFAYLMAHLIDVHTGRLIGNYISEIKGNDKKLTLKGVESLAVKIDKTLKNN
ncbi:MAG: DUF3280 domain-containing protein [Methylobacter sp.]|uniref:DUF2380 domain-containing protein n=1 Tax=Methylobacter sp. TaxID=2051955 RepID=UPI0025851050|nr:DUF2380 domain-containing protein [Methylobacter sp.]MCL7420192.1 DUF3280 domain-containing protein [Methylobacter sp.]